MKNLWRFIFELIVWLFKLFVCIFWKARLVWFLIAFLAAPIFIVFLCPENSDNILRYFGMSLELFGIGTVAFSLWGRWVLFKLPNFIKVWLDNLPQFPRWNRKPQHAAWTSTGGIVVGGSSEASGWHPPQPDSPLDVRITLLEENVVRFYSRLNNVDKKFKQVERRQDEYLKTERKIRENDHKEIKATLNELGAGGLHLEFIGVYWLTLGLIFSTIPQEISCVAKRLIQFVI